MGVVEKVKTRSGETADLIAFLWRAKMWFLIPFIVILILFAAIIIFASATGVAPFVYTII